MSDFYEIPNSTNDFKSRSNDIFDRLINLEKQHDVQTKSTIPTIAPEDESVKNSSDLNPTIPAHAIVFKKRPADAETFTRPDNKWTKYNLEDVNEHQLSEAGNRHALKEFFRTRTKEEEESRPEPPVFQRPMKKAILTNDDEDEEQPRSINVRAQAPATSRSDDPDDRDIKSYKLTTQKKTRGVFSTNKKEPIKEQMDVPEEKSDSNDEDDEDNDELFEP